MDIVAVREGIVGALASISGLHFYDTVPDSPLTPAVVVFPESILYAQTFDGMVQSIFVIHVLSSTVVAQGGQNLLDSFISPTGTGSIPAALAVDATLGGAAASAELTEMRNYGTLQIVDGGTRYYSVQLLVTVYAMA
jgi:hypothetical protein